MCQVKTYHTELATTCPCMAPIEIHNSETCWTSILEIANESHDPTVIFMIYLTRVATHKGLDICLGLDSCLPATSDLLASHSSPFTIIYANFQSYLNFHKMWDVPGFHSAGHILWWVPLISNTKPSLHPIFQYMAITVKLYFFVAQSS